MRRVHRNVEYTVNSVDGAEWSWDAYPQKNHVAGSPLHGTVKGTEADAVKACEAAIDKAFDDENSN